MTEGQARHHSVLESILNTASGFVLSLVAVEFLFPAIGIQSTHSENLAAVAAMTGISLVRSYFWRRIFNRF